MNGVSIIMVSYHTGAPLWLAIESALNEPECLELILVDNGNVPGVQSILQKVSEKEPRFRFITGHGNVGFAKGCNLGAHASIGDVILLLNPDCMLPQGGLATALEIMQHYPENTLAGCYLVNPDGSEQRGCRRELFTPKNSAAEALGLEKLFKIEKPLNMTDAMPEAAHEVPAISGAFMMLSRGFYERLGGMDEGYFLHMEDMDLCLRAHKAGGKVICMPEVKVMHFRSTSDASGRVVEKHKTRSFIRYFNLHFSDSYSSLSLNILSLLIWLRYGLKVIAGIMDSVFVPPLAAKRDVARIALLYRFVRFSPGGEALAGKTLLVTGASGQIGLCVIGRALAQGAHVIAIYHRTEIPFSHPNLAWVQRDLATQTLDIKADVVIHTAALWYLPERLAEVIDAGAKRIIAFGSTSLLAKASSENIHEQEIVQKLKTAEESIFKIAAEKNASVTLLRPTMIYGVGLDANITRMANVIRRFGILAVHGEAKGLRQPVQASDLSDAALTVINNPVTFGKAYNIGGSQTITYSEMVTLLFLYLGKRLRVVRPPFLPTALDWLGWIYQMDHINGQMAQRMNQDLAFEIEDAITDFGYHPKGFLQGTPIL